MKKSILLSLLLLSFILGIYGCGNKNVAQDVKIKSEFFTTAKGLPGNSITALSYFGRELWAGTKSGLARHDGVQWQVHVKKNTNVLGSEIIEALYVGEDAIYVATDNGVCKYNGNNWASVLTGSRARSVAAKQGEVAMATAHGVDTSSGAGTVTYSKETAGLVNDEVNVVSYDSTGRLWAGTNAGMGVLSGSAFQNFTGPAKQIVGNSLVDVPPSPPNCQLSGNNILCIIKFKGLLAIGTTSGLTISDMSNQWSSFTAAHSDFVQKAGNIVQEQVSGNSPMPGNTVKALTGVSDSILFIGTNKGLAVKKDNTWLDVSKHFSEISGKSITALAAQNDELWVGTQEGLYHFTGISALTAQNSEPAK
ncbi:MAG: hypothetical protein HQM10_13425 [Candidatus Riflebacteria bacterium]|nr:hypothetical protein [Candidatus Riflebacteria bacterium]